jgi:hypothetical protein
MSKDFVRKKKGKVHVSSSNYHTIDNVPLKLSIWTKENTISKTKLNTKK